ncbi:MAG TPA: ABC transporter ATP-binding protein [Candidatus Faecalibacterium intestinigallinarum]|uniref:ABC transporter ATP-binding protein n=1 Tax=Candidatus Faecalibacterium intestinigallinarum TaxID=2838581 RepID=A0A9D1TWH4_9FIRM|nr:ABC transporter ATP-binding protein [Candidatus Faecalibacterium intestinigallinarum]
MSILQTKGLKKYYGAGDTEVRALDGVDLTVEQGEFVAIVGTSGSGKSTLLHMLGGLDRPTAGKVTVDGKDIFALKDEELTIFRRRKIGFVFQSYNLVPVLSVWENIVLPIQLDGRAVDETFVREVVATLGLEKKLQSLPSQLSGGQQQRVAIARALATKPAILLADEPTGNLDSKTSQDVLGLMKVTSQKFGQTMVMITHNEEIAQLAGRIVRIEDGRIVTR